MTTSTLVAVLMTTGLLFAALPLVVELIADYLGALSRLTVSVRCSLADWKRRVNQRGCMGIYPVRNRRVIDDGWEGC